MNEKEQKVIDEAKWAVDLFDQANTNGAVVNLGSRGVILGKAMDDLRAALRKAGFPSTLPNENSLAHLRKQRVVVARCSVDGRPIYDK